MRPARKGPEKVRDPERAVRGPPASMRPARKGPEKERLELRVAELEHELQ